MKKMFLFSAIVAVIFTSCYYHKEDILYGTNCDTTNVKYSSTIKSLLNNYSCLSCHAGANPPGGINLETYANVKTMVDNGRLYGAITHAGGFRPMPDGGSKMNFCDINKIKAWMDAGAPDN
jgi:hypothetical protein